VSNPHGGDEILFPSPVKLTKLGIAIITRILFLILCPKQSAGYPFSPQFLMDQCPVGTAPLPINFYYRREKLLFQSLIIKLFRKRPAKARF
jgi:hypothetical protein